MVSPKLVSIVDIVSRNVLMKTSSATGNIFFGVACIKKAGCPALQLGLATHDQETLNSLERLHSDEERQTEEAALIVDIHELEWRSSCTCGLPRASYI
jgi:hypothetical protein